MKWYVRPEGGVFLLDGCRLIAWSRRIDPLWIAEQEGLAAELRYAEYRQGPPPAPPPPQTRRRRWWRR